MPASPPKETGRSAVIRRIEFTHWAQQSAMQGQVASAVVVVVESP
jgi:hypothetical protein